MCKSMQSVELSEVLAENMQRINEAKETLFKEYFSENVEDSFEFEFLVREYIETIKKHMKKGSKETVEKDNFPFAILWSIVEARDIDNMETHRFYICPPYLRNNDTGLDCVSMTSPLGRALLLKKADQVITVNVPQGTFNYRIKRIIIP